MAKLTVVPTPVGNLEDMTFRAIHVLKEADLILAEDTRTTGILLKHFEIQNKMQSHHKFNEHKTVEQIAAVSREAKISPLFPSRYAGHLRSGIHVGEGMCSPRGRRRVPARSYGFRARLGSVRITQ